MIDLTEVGAFPSVVPGGFQIRIGLYLPGIRAADGFASFIRRTASTRRFSRRIRRWRGKPGIRSTFGVLPSRCSLSLEPTLAAKASIFTASSFGGLRPVVRGN
jgi:hypothetical protein